MSPNVAMKKFNLIALIEWPQKESFQDNKFITLWIFISFFIQGKYNAGDYLRAVPENTIYY